jgi:hypothetical protein
VDPASSVRRHRSTLSAARHTTPARHPLLRGSPSWLRRFLASDERRVGAPLVWWACWPGGPMRRGKPPRFCPNLWAPRSACGRPWRSLPTLELGRWLALQNCWQTNEPLPVKTPRGLGRRRAWRSPDHRTCVRVIWVQQRSKLEAIHQLMFKPQGWSCRSTTDVRCRPT